MKPWWPTLGAQPGLRPAGSIPLAGRRWRASAAAGLAAAAVAVAAAQSYSAGRADGANPHDAPIPGFTGPGGDGAAPLAGFATPEAMGNRVNPLFTAWAAEVVEYRPAPGVDAFWQYAGETLGPVTGDVFAVASLGDLDAAALAAGVAPGRLTVRFAEPLRDFTGADFAVFENGHEAVLDTGGSGVGGVWAELAYVEVSSDGVHFARFPADAQVPGPVGSYGTIDPRAVRNLAGKHVNAYGQSWGTPFDLAELAADPLVAAGLLDLQRVTQVRLVDVPGRGDFLDAAGRPIHDGWPTSGSGGADIEAVGAIGQEITYAAWEAGRGLARDGDDDGDGWSHFAEHALGLDPDAYDPPGVARLRRQGAGEMEAEGGGLVFTFPRDERLTAVRYVVEVQEGDLDPAGWREVAGLGPRRAVAILGDEVAGIDLVPVAGPASVGVRQQVRVRLRPPPTAGGAFFVRLRLEEVPGA